MVLLYKAIISLLNLIEMAIVVRILFSFLNIGRTNLLTNFIYDITDPVLNPARALIQKLGIRTGMFDFAPLIAVFALRAISNIIRVKLI